MCSAKVRSRASHDGAPRACAGAGWRGSPRERNEARFPRGFCASCVQQRPGLRLAHSPPSSRCCAGAFGQVREGMRVDDGDKFGLRVAVKIISRRLIKKVGVARRCPALLPRHFLPR